MRAYDFLTELTLPKNKWELVISTADKHEVSDELIQLVRTAYSSTEQGSFVRSVKDVLASDWLVIDCDNDPDIDGAIFYRGPRANEHWSGYKIQGTGHDGSGKSKLEVTKKKIELLSQPGWWCESSHAARQVMLKRGVKVVTDVTLLRQLFNDPTLHMIDDKTYIRHIPSGEIVETVFGNPIVRGT